MIRSTKSLLAAAAIAVAATLFSPAPSARANTVTCWVRYNDIPRRARECIDRERGRYDVKQILEMRYDGRCCYRVLIDERGTDRAIFVSDGGRVLGAQEIPDLPTGPGYFERYVRYDDLPWDVRRTCDNERGNNPIRSIQFVRRDGREFYRVIVDTRGDDLAIRINNAGKLLSVDEVEDFIAVGRERRRYDEERERIVTITELPGDCRRTIDRERGAREIREVVYVERNGRRFYRVTVIDQRRGDCVYRVADDGYLYEENEVPDIVVGPGRYEEVRFGHEGPMRYGQLPWPVREALDHERHGRDVRQITYVRRYNHTFYRCVIDTRGDDLAIRIDDDGRIVSREEVEDTAWGRREVETVVVREREPVREEAIRYNALPAAVRRKLDVERGRFTVLKVTRFEVKGRPCYRCVYDSHPFQTTVRIWEDGRLYAD
jgi:hypothetical protein